MTDDVSWQYNWGTKSICCDYMKIWHPFTQEKTAPLPLKIVRGDREYLYDEAGNSYVDMISSWWVNILGHSQLEIADAIAKWLAKLPPRECPVAAKKSYLSITPFVDN